jgi:hypothetical protein
VTGRTAARRVENGDDGGSAIIEFVFVAVVVMVPLVYLIVGVAVVQRSQLATSDAARSVGRAYATSPTPQQAMPRAQAALNLALADQGLGAATLRFVAAGASCTGPAVVPQLRPGSEFTVCVSRRVQLPAVPSVLGGRGITTLSEYLVHVDDYRSEDP